MAVRCTVVETQGVLVAHLDGVLNARGVANLHRSLLKCLAQQPDAMIVDLSGLQVDDQLSTTVFVALTRQAAFWPGIPVLLCAPGAQARWVLGRAAYRNLAVFADEATARAQLPDGRAVLRSVRDELLPVPGTVRRARDMATETCLRWDLPQLLGPASTIAGELVANAVAHAATNVTVRMSLTRRFLHISVRDGSDELPQLDGGVLSAPTTGHGLHLVEAVASSWGCLPADRGKVVWACLALGPDPSR